SRLWRCYRQRCRASPEELGSTKLQEKRKKLHTAGDAGPEPLLSAVSSKMPALQEACKISSKAAHVGFDWPALQGLFEKLSEETRELQEHIQNLPPASMAGEKPKVP